MNETVGLITYALDRAPAGIARYTNELSRALCRAGVPLTILRAGGARHPSGGSRLFGSGLLPGLMTIGQAEIAWAARSQKLSIIHDPTGNAPLLLTGARRVATIHDVIPYIYPETSTRLDWLIYHFWLPLVAPKLDAIITDSEQSRAGIVRYLPVKPENVFVIPAAASPIFQPRKREQVENVLLRHGIDFPYILYVGSIEARKNLSNLLEAYAQVRSWSPKWKLVIVGAPKWKYSPVFDTVQRLHLAPDVHFTGYVSDEDLPALYNAASLFVFPSLYEGFGLPVLEAMASGLPVITSNCSSLPEVTGDAAILVDPHHANAIAAAICQVLAEPDLADHLREKGIARARLFTWERTARETITVYRNVMG